MKILMVAAEAVPFAKTGGLADVAGVLPRFLRALGHDVRVVIDMKSEFYMSGTTIDFNDGLMERGFTFKNPIASGTCGCGSSFSI